MKKKNIILALFFAILFLILMVLVVFGYTAKFDTYVYDFIISFRNSFLDHYFITVTKLGNTSIVVLVVLILALIFRNRYSIFLIVSSIDSVILNTIFKYIIQRPRPNELRLISQSGYSFPSGHAMISICLYGYLCYLAFTKIKNKVYKYVVSTILILVILSIGVSRIYVGVHYASDVVAGYLLALSYLVILIEVTKKIDFRKE